MINFDKYIPNIIIHFVSLILIVSWTKTNKIPSFKVWIEIQKTTIFNDHSHTFPYLISPSLNPPSSSFPISLPFLRQFLQFLQYLCMLTKFTSLLWGLPVSDYLTMFPPGLVIYHELLFPTPPFHLPFPSLPTSLSSYRQHSWQTST